MLATSVSVSQYVPSARRRRHSALRVAPGVAATSARTVEALAASSGCSRSMSSECLSASGSLPRSFAADGVM